MSARILCRRRALLAAMGAAGLGAGISHAATLRDDVSQSQSASASSASQFAASGFVYISGYDIAGSGTLIAPGWVLTAAHAVTNTNDPGDPVYPLSDIGFGQGATANLSDTISAAAVYVAPEWDGNSVQGNDLALIELSQPITSVSPAMLYNSSLPSELNQIATVIGYGYAGTGSAGYTADTFGTRLAIETQIDAFGGGTIITGDGTQASLAGISSNLMLTDFDDPNNPNLGAEGTTAQPLEGASAPGDSGGGLFLTEQNGTTYLAGVTDFGITYDNSTFNASYGQGNGYTRVAVSQSANFIDSTMAQPCTWSGAGDGSWATPGNWSGGNIPQFAAATATFGSTNTSAATITLDDTWSVGTLSFSSPNSYTIAAGTGNIPGTLVMDGGIGGTAAINDLLGNHFISAPMTLNTNTTITVSNATNALQISGAIDGIGGITLAGTGSLILSGANTYSGATAINGGELVIGSPNTLPSGTALTISGGTLNISNYSIILDYTGSSPASTIRQYLISGYNGGKWNGTGIATSAPTGTTYGVGYADWADPGNPAGLASDQIKVMYTLNGDANLDGTVNSVDFGILAANFGMSGRTWDEGDFTYTGTVNSIDFGLLAANFGKSISGPSVSETTADWAALDAFAAANGLMADVPEPATGGIIICVAAMVLSRRRSSNTIEQNRTVFSRKHV